VKKGCDKEEVMLEVGVVRLDGKRRKERKKERMWET
jgi:hypothetical protein